VTIVITPHRRQKSWYDTGSSYIPHFAIFLNSLSCILPSKREAKFDTHIKQQAKLQFYVCCSLCVFRQQTNKQTNKSFFTSWQQKFSECNLHLICFLTYNRCKIDCINLRSRISSFQYFAKCRSWSTARLRRVWGLGGVQIFQILLRLLFALIYRHIPLVRCIFNNLSADKTRRI